MATEGKKGSGKERILKGYEVEWCEHVPKFDDGSCDMDLAEWQVKDFRGRDEAIAFAKEKLPLDAFGSVRVTPFELVELEPGIRAYHREFTGEPEHIED